MYAIVDIAGQQVKVEKSWEIFVNRIDAKEGDEVSFDQVMLIENKGKTTLGSPTIPKAKVVGVVLEHLKGDKVLVFKKKRRKGYQKLNGHRQYLTKLEIKDIVTSAAAKKKSTEETTKKSEKVAEKSDKE